MTTTIDRLFHITPNTGETTNTGFFKTRNTFVSKILSKQHSVVHTSFTGDGDKGLAGVIFEAKNNLAILAEQGLANRATVETDGEVVAYLEVTNKETQLGQLKVRITTRKE